MQLITMIMIYCWDKNLKKIACPGSWSNNSYEKHWYDVVSSKDEFLQDVYQMTTIVLLSEINHYHINKLHLFWDTLFMYVYIPLASLTYRLSQHSTLWMMDVSGISEA